MVKCDLFSDSNICDPTNFWKLLLIFVAAVVSYYGF